MAYAADRRPGAKILASLETAHRKSLAIQQRNTPVPGMTMKQFEKSSTDKKLDKKYGYKEGSKKDNAMDRKALKKNNKNKK